MYYVEHNPERAGLIRPDAEYVVRNSNNGGIVNAGDKDYCERWVRAKAHEDRNAARLWNN